MEESWSVPQNSEELKAGLFAKLDCAKILLQLLKFLQFKEDVVIQSTPKGIKITAQASKCFFASAFMQKEIFAKYLVRATTDEDEHDEYEIMFSISLQTLVHCLNVCGSSVAILGGGGQTAFNWTSSSNVTTASLLLHYPGAGQPLYLWIEENGIITGASIPTLDLGDDRYCDVTSMTNQKIVARIIIVAEPLCDIFNEFDSKIDVIEFKVCPDQHILSISTSSTMINSFTVDIPLDSEMVSHAQVDEFVSTKYQFQMVKHALKPITMAEKVSIRFDSRHFLSIQYMIKLNESDAACFMEFYCAPEVD